MERVVNVDMTINTAKAETALNKFFKKYADLAYWREQLEYMLDNGYRERKQYRLWYKRMDVGSSRSAGRSLVLLCNNRKSINQQTSRAARLKAAERTVHIMKKFEIGKSYSAHSICDHNCIWTFTVISRTEQTITAQLDNEKEPRRMRIHKKFSEWRNAESVLPLGNYSMAPIISAD